MSLEVLSTGAAVGTFVVIAATAIAAVVQLRHLRAQNQLTGLLTVLARVEDPQFNAWVDGAREMINSRLPDPAYRRSILDGTYERKDNPWLNLANSYDWVGSLVKYKLIPEESLLDVYTGRIIQAWEIIEGIVPLVRKRSGPGVWEKNFEYLVVRRATLWQNIRKALILRACRDCRSTSRGLNSRRTLGPIDGDATMGDNGRIRGWETRKLQEVTMYTVQSEIAALEERLRLAELGPDPEFFEEALADDVVLVSQDGQPSFAKSKVVEAHQSGKGPKFSRVEMRDMKILDHGTAAVVTCRGTYEDPQSNFTLKFMRVWLKKNNRWQIIAGSVSN